MKYQHMPVCVLWKLFRDSGEIEIRNELILQYRYLLKLHAAKLARRLPLQITIDEIASVAFDGLLGAIESYDPARKVKFETYASKRISGAVLDWLRSLDPQSRSIREFESRHAQANVIASSDAGRQATSAEIADRMGLSNAEYDRFARRSRAGRTVPLHACSNERRSSRCSGAGADTIPNTNEPAPYTGLERDMLKDHICRGLCAAERRVLCLYYFNGLTMAETGNVLGLSESRISQLHRKVLEKLRNRFAHQNVYGTLRQAI